MEKITFLVFTCEKYSNLWDYNVQLLLENVSDDLIENIFLITDKPHSGNVRNASIVVANDDNDFIVRFSKGIEVCATSRFIFLLDDYFIKNISDKKMIKLLSFFDENNIDYCKLYCRNKRYLKKSKPYFLINTSIKYSVDLYPGIWNKNFAKLIVDNWSSIKRSIWDFEANLWKQEQISKSQKCICAIGGELDFLDVVRKGKIIRHSYNYLKRKNIKIEGMKKRSVIDSFKDHMLVFLSHILPEKTKQKLKKKFAKETYGDE